MPRKMRSWKIMKRLIVDGETKEGNKRKKKRKTVKINPKTKRRKRIRNEG